MITAKRKIETEIDPISYNRVFFEESVLFRCTFFEILLEQKYINPREAYCLVLVFRAEKKFKDLIEKYIIDAIEERDHSHIKKFAPFNVYLTGSYIMNLIFGFEFNDMDYVVEVGEYTKKIDRDSVSETTELGVETISLKGSFYKYSLENTLISVFYIESKKSDIIFVGEMKRYIDNYPLDVSKSCYNLNTKKLTVLNWLEIIKKTPTLTLKYKTQCDNLTEKYVKRMQKSGLPVILITMKEAKKQSKKVVHPVKRRIK